MATKYVSVYRVAHSQEQQLIKASAIIGDSTNNAVEGRFASVDTEMNRCRQSNPISVGGNVSAKHDHIVGFLEAKDEEVRDELCIGAMKGGQEGN